MTIRVTSERARVVVVVDRRGSQGPAGSGSGDVIGPSFATDGHAAVFDGATGKVIRSAGAAPVLEGDSRLTDARTPTAHTHSASDVTSGTFSAARIPDLDASKITSGTVATARLGSGTASPSTFLRGDQTWATVTGGGSAGWKPVLLGSTRVTANFGTPLTALTSFQGTCVVGTNRILALLVGNMVESTISELLFEVTATSLSSGQSVTVGAAEIQTSNGLPGDILWQESIVVGTSTGVIAKTGLSRTIPTASYLFVANPSTNAGSVTFRGGGPALGPSQIMAPFSGSVGNRAGFECAGDVPTSFTTITEVTSGYSSSARWGFLDSFPLISAVR